MPGKRYISRLFVVEQPDGKQLVTFDLPPEAGHVQAVTFSGPTPVQLPDQPLTPQEYNAWIEKIERQPSFTRHYMVRREGEPAIEEVESQEDMLAQAKVRTDLSWSDGEEGQPRLLLVEIENIGPVPIPELKLEWVWECETPQPFTMGGIAAREEGGRLAFFHPEASFSGTLQPGEIRQFQLDQAALAQIRSHVASLSPERYRIGLRSGDYEFEQIPGERVGGYVEELEA